MNITAIVLITLNSGLWLHNVVTLMRIVYL